MCRRVASSPWGMVHCEGSMPAGPAPAAAWTGAEAPDDQKRTLPPKEALQVGANWLVIGRPIYPAENPRAAAEQILASLERS